MNRCLICREFFSDDERIIVREDPSPTGITALPSGYEEYSFCPHCGSDEFVEFNLADELEVEDGKEETEAYISYEGKRIKLFLDRNGELQFGWLKPKETPARRAVETAKEVPA